MGHARYLNVRCHHVTVSQPTGGNSPSIQGSLRPVSGSWAWRRGRLLPEGGPTGRDASAIRIGDTTYHAMAFAEGDIDTHGRFEPLAADMMPYDSGADIDTAWGPVNTHTGASLYKKFALAAGRAAVASLQEEAARTVIRSDGLRAPQDGPHSTARTQHDRDTVDVHGRNGGPPAKAARV